MVVEGRLLVTVVVAMVVAVVGAGLACLAILNIEVHI